MVAGPGAVTLDKTCVPTDIPYHEWVPCEITAENLSLDPQTVTIYDQLPRETRIVPGSVWNGMELGPRSLTSTATLAPVAPPIVDVAIKPLASPARDSKATG